ncbi:MAG TPA: response regulator [Methylovirgula sp.]|nr:response regulator [Methylovirgula sp.]
MTVTGNRRDTASFRHSAGPDDEAGFASASRTPGGLPPAEAAGEESGAVSAEQGPRILIVEDDYFVGLQNEDMLAKAGFNVIGIATTAEYALTLAAERKPDLVLMDIRLAHGGDGIDAAMKLLQRFGIRSIFATAHADAGTRSRAAAAKPLGWVVKPFTAAALVKSVRDALAAKRSESG